MNRRNTLKTLAAASCSFLLPQAVHAKLNKLNSKISLGLIADPHIGFVPKAEDRLDAFLKEMRSVKPNALIQLGDFAHPNEKLKPVAEKFNAAHQHTFHVIGNHDLDHGLKTQDAVRVWAMPAPYYSKVVDGLKIIVLDGNDKGSPTHATHGGYPSYIGPEQVTWLKQQLENASQPVLIVSHQPLAGRGAVDNAEDIQKILSQHKDKIVLSINGHSHLDCHLEVGGIHYLHINSASYYWLGGKVRLAQYKDPLFATLTIDPKMATVSLLGRESEWLDGTPEDVDYFKGKHAGMEDIVVPKISPRLVKNIESLS